MMMKQGAQLLSGRVLDPRLRGRTFEPHLCCFPEQDTYNLSSAGLTQEDLSRYD